MLGAATPIGDLVRYIGESRPVAVGLSIASPLAIGSLAATIGALQEVELAPPIFVGGWCIERYPGVSAAVGVQSCVTTRDTLAFLDGLRGRE